MAAKGFRTLQQAKKQVAELQEFIELVEGYPEGTLREIVVKRYALTSSLAQVAGELNRRGYSVDGDPYQTGDVVRVIEGSSQGDPLHRIVRSGYRAKIKHNRKKESSFSF